MSILLEENQATLQGRGGKQPRYLQLAQTLRQQILNRELRAGDRLPSFAQFRLEHGVTPTTTERVYSILEEEGLIERRHGVGTFVVEPKRASTGNIGLIGPIQPQPRLDPFASHLLKGIQVGIDQQRCHLLHMGTDYALKLEAAKKIDGVLICNVESVETVFDQLPASLPRVSLLNVAPGIASIIADDYAGGRLAVEHLRKLGHRRIGCLMEKLPSIARRRFAGYYDAMLEAGSEPQTTWMRLTESVPRPIAKDQPYLTWARQQMREWLAEGFMDAGCTAIVVQNEVAGIGVMQVLQEARISVPYQVSVIGFDGTEVCDLVVPRLTAVELPLEEIGVKGVEVLGRQIAGEVLGEQVIVLPMKLREGDSLAAPYMQKRSR